MRTPREHSEISMCFRPLADSLRFLMATAGILALMFQLLLPVVAQASGGDWIEICSEAGPVMMQLDAKDEGDTSDQCPRCKNCTLCVVTASVLNTGFAEIFDADRTQMIAVIWHHPELRSVSKYARPEARGPPRATQYTSDCAPRAAIATPLNTGGALWT